MKLLLEQYEEYINNPKSFYDFIHLHDGIIVSLKIDRNIFEIEVDAHEWENCNYLLKFSNPRNFYIKKEDSTNLFIDNKELIGISINDCILDFNLIKFNGQNYFTFLLNEYMHSLLFRADSLEIIEL